MMSDGGRRAVVEELKIHRTTDLEEVIGLEVTARSYRYVQNVCATIVDLKLYDPGM